LKEQGEICFGGAKSDLYWVKSISFFFNFRSEELIKNAISANEFLKNLDQGQIEAVIEAMYAKEYEENCNVITEGETGLLYKS
jgi:hypothetical protein